MPSDKPQIVVRVDAATKARWVQAAKRAGLTLNEYIRQAADAVGDGLFLRRLAEGERTDADAQPRDVAARAVAVPGTSAVAGGKEFRGMDPRVKGPKVEQEPRRRRGR